MVFVEKCNFVGDKSIYHNMKRLKLILCTLIFVTLCAIGKERTNAEMINIARGVLLTTNGAKAKGYGEPVMQLVKSSERLGVVAAEGYGFVVVNRNDMGRPVLGFSQTDYDADNLPEGLVWWLETTEDALSKGIMGAYDSDILCVDETIENFISTTWDQGRPYNDKCPNVKKGTTKSKAPVGCVATSMAQIINYFKYPAKGQGSGTYSVVNGTDTTFVKAFVNGTYQYDKLKDTYSKTETDKEPISTLMFDAGKACNMQYEYGGSGATLIDCAKGMAYNFSYDSLAINYYAKMCHTDKEWFTMVKKELTEKKPILYSGTTKTNGGHAFILSGLNTEGMVWVNWGWSGSGDGWYAIDHLATEKYDFSNNNEMLIGFTPQASPKPGEKNISQLYYLSEDYLELKKVGRNVFTKPFYYYNFGWRVFSGDVRMVLEDEDTKKVEYSYIQSSENIIEAYWGIGFNNDINIREFFTNTFKFGLVEGHYKVWAECKSKEENEWRTITRINDHAACSWFAVAADGSVTINNNESTTDITAVTKENDYNTSEIYDLNGRKLDNTVPANAAANRKIVIVKKGKSVEKKEF